MLVLQYRRDARLQVKGEGRRVCAVQRENRDGGGRRLPLAVPPIKIGVLAVGALRGGIRGPPSLGRKASMSRYLRRSTVTARHVVRRRRAMRRCSRCPLFTLARKSDGAVHRPLRDSKMDARRRTAPSCITQHPVGVCVSISAHTLRALLEDPRSSAASQTGHERETGTGARQRTATDGGQQGSSLRSFKWEAERTGPEEERSYARFIFLLRDILDSARTRRRRRARRPHTVARVRIIGRASQHGRRPSRGLWVRQYLCILAGRHGACRRRAGVERRRVE